jgi:alanyl-tRNA synthetase
MTTRLYQDDSYLAEFEACVVETRKHPDGWATVLEATCFYPASGGQPADTGTIGSTRVEDVVEDGDTVLHMSQARPECAAGDRVEARIDWERRHTNMQVHTGQHILSSAFIRALEAPTVSSKLGVESSTIDVARLDLTWDDVEAAERLANSVVFENRRVRVYEARPEDAADLRIKRALDREVFRIIEIEGFDKSPCGGTHCRMTGEIGIIKVLRWERVRDTSRMEFLCGRQAETDYFWKSRFIVDLAADLTTKDASIPGIIGDQLETNRELRREVANLRSRLIAGEAGDLAGGAEIVSGVRIVAKVFPDRRPPELRALAAAITANPGTVALLASGGTRAHFVFARSPDVEVDMRKVVETACAVVDGRGGGKPEASEGGGKRGGRTGEAVDLALASVRAGLAG